MLLAFIGKKQSAFKTELREINTKSMESSDPMACENRGALQVQIAAEQTPHKKTPKTHTHTHMARCPLHASMQCARGADNTQLEMGWATCHNLKTGIRPKNKGKIQNKNPRTGRNKFNRKKRKWH